MRSTPISARPPPQRCEDSAEFGSSHVPVWLINQQGSNGFQDAAPLGHQSHRNTFEDLERRLSGPEDARTYLRASAALPAFFLTSWPTAAGSVERRNRRRALRCRRKRHRLKRFPLSIGWVEST